MEKYKLNGINMFMGILFFVMGVIFAVLAVISFNKWSEFKENAVTVSAEITDIKAHQDYSRKNKNRNYHDVYIEYEYGGKTYNDVLGYYNTGMTVGGNVTIYINAQNPSENMANPWVVIGIFSAMVFIFGGMGICFVVYEISTGAYINRLISEDKYVVAQYSGEKPSGTRVNNVRYNWSIFVYDKGFGDIWEFRSRPHDPSECPYADGDSVRVYVDMEKDPRKYYVSREK